MRLSDFEAHFDDKILRRGLDYYKNGHVTELERDGTAWEARVSGNDEYEVSVTMSEDGEITGCFCDCPYDFGDYCKHLAALLYAVRDEINKSDSKSKNKPVKPSLAELLQKAEKSALIAIITELAEESHVIRDRLIFRLADKESAADNARKLIRSAVKSVTRHGFVEYGDVDRAVEGAEEALNMAGKLLEGGGFLACAEICVIIAEEMMDLMNNCDDSNGTAGGMISGAVSLMSEAAGKIPEDHPDADRLFRVMLNHADNKIYSGWDWRMDILAACVPLCGDRARREEFESYFLQMRMRSDKKGWDKSFEDRHVQGIALKLITLFDGPERAEAFIRQNLDNPDFRRASIERAFEKGDPAGALRLCEEGESNSADHRGLVSEWKKYRYKAYELLNDESGQRILAEEFLKDGDFKYYDKLKALYTADEWPDILTRLLNELEKKQDGVYVDILVKEGLKSRLLAYCRVNTYSLVRLYPHLLPEYKNETGEIFAAFIAGCAERASNRRDYQDVCKIVKHYGKACGKKAMNETRLALTLKYPRRPAFLDELRRL